MKSRKVWKCRKVGEVGKVGKLGKIGKTGKVEKVGKVGKGGKDIKSRKSVPVPDLFEVQVLDGRVDLEEVQLSLCHVQGGGDCALTDDLDGNPVQVWHPEVQPDLSQMFHSCIECSEY